MKKSLFLFNLIVLSFCSDAQNLEFNAMDPHPVLYGALFGASEFSDIDGDGDMDLYLSGRQDGWTSNDRSTIYFNDGAGNFTEDLTTDIHAVQFASGQFADLDGDGDDDLLIMGSGDGGNSFTGIYLNDGLGGFSLLANTNLSPCESGDLAVEDIDGDNDLDILMVGSNVQILEPTLTVRKLYLNDGSANFTEAVGSNLENMNMNSVELGDIDGDGDLDILSTGLDSEDEPVFSWYQNNGAAVFTQVDSGLDQVGEGDFALGDTDGDGDLDVFISGKETGGGTEVYYYLNDGFGQYSLSSASDDFLSLSLGENSFQDFDNDGDLDVFMTGAGDGGLGSVNGIVSMVYENLGNNSFIQSDSLTGSYLSNAGFGDLNGDGLIDILISGTTVGSPTFKTWLYTNAIADCPADVNSDGEIDIDDFLMFNSAFGSICPSCPEDINNDGAVDINDFLELNSAFGSSCD